MLKGPTALRGSFLLRISRVYTTRRVHKSTSSGRNFRQKKGFRGKTCTETRLYLRNMHHPSNLFLKHRLIFRIYSCSSLAAQPNLSTTSHPQKRSRNIFRSSAMTLMTLRLLKTRSCCRPPEEPRHLWFAIDRPFCGIHDEDL